MDPREAIRDIEQTASLPSGRGDRFAGYSVPALPFRSGHVLALRRFPASSLGPAYTSVWHRTPSGVWTFYSNVAPEQGCGRYFDREVEHHVVAPIRIEWSTARQLRVVVEGRHPIAWYLTLRETPASRAMNAVARWLPENWWRNAVALRLMSGAARLALATGPVNLTGRTPNGQRFVSNPRHVWMVKASRAFIDGADAGEIGPLAETAQLGDFRVPRRGVFAIGRAFVVEDRSPAQAHPRIAA